MTEKGRIERGQERNFILSGNATFTVKNTQTGGRFTFKVTQPDASGPHFVKVLTGSDNESDYGYLGTIFNAGQYKHGRKSGISETAQSAKVFKWFLACLASETLPEQIEVWHEGRCGRCGRKLTVPESIKSGYGPECLGMLREWGRTAWA